MDFAKSDKDLELLKALLEIANLLGRYLIPDTYVRYILPRLSGDVSVVQFATDASSRCTVMEVLGAMLSGSKTIRVAEKFDEVMKIITDSFIVSPESLALRQSALSIMDSLLLALECHPQLWCQSKTVLKKVTAALLFDLTPDSLRQQASQCLTRFAKICVAAGGGNIRQFLRSLGSEILADVMTNYEADADWSVQSKEHTLLLTLFSCPYLLFTEGGSFNLKTSLRFLKQMVSKDSLRFIPPTLEVSFLKAFNALLITLLLPVFTPSFVPLPIYAELIGSSDDVSPEDSGFALTELESAFASEFPAVVDCFILSDRWSRDPTLQICRLNLVSLLLTESAPSGMERFLSALSRRDRDILAAALLGTVLSSTSKAGVPSDVRIQAVGISSALIGYYSEPFRSLKIIPLVDLSSTELEFRDQLSAKISLKTGILLMLTLLDDPCDDVVLKVVEALSLSLPFLCARGHDRFAHLLSLEFFIARVLTALASAGTAMEAGTFSDAIDFLLRSVSALDIALFEKALNDSLAPPCVGAMELVSGLRDHIGLLKSLSKK